MTAPASVTAPSDRPQGRPRRRLSRSGDFDRVYRDGSSRANRHLVVYSYPREDAGGEVRLGIAVGRKVGGAVQRNKVKRAIREAFWELAGDRPADHDFVVIARPGVEKLVAEGGTEALSEQLGELLSEDEAGSV